MKLTKDQKAARKEMIADLNEVGGMLFTDGDTTVAIMQHTKADGTAGDFVTYGASYCNPCDEYKRKYGEFLALTRFFNALDSSCGENQLPMSGDSIEDFVERVFFGGICFGPNWPFTTD